MVRAWWANGTSVSRNAVMERRNTRENRPGLPNLGTASGDSWQRVAEARTSCVTQRTLPISNTHGIQIQTQHSVNAHEHLTSVRSVSSHGFSCSWMCWPRFLLAMESSLFSR